MKIVIFNVLCKDKSTGKIAYNLYQHYTELGNDCKIIYGRGKKYTCNKDFIKVANVFDVGYNYFKDECLKNKESNSINSTKKALKTLNTFKPDVVILLNLHGYYINDIKLMHFMKSNNIPAVYFMCDEYPFMGKCTYSGDCKKYITECKECICSKSEDFANIKFKEKQKIYDNYDNLAFASVEYNIAKAKDSMLLKDKQLYVVNTGIDTEFYHPRNTEKIKQKLGIANDKICLVLVAPSRYVRKGTKYFLKAAEILESDNRFVFIHVGYSGQKNKLPLNFIPIEYVHNQDELAEYYSMADCLVCTSLNDSMPNVCLEALSCGSPFSYFNVSGMPFIAEKPQGNKIAEVSETSLSEYLKTVQPKTEILIKACRDYAIERFSKKMLADNILKIAEEMRSK